MKILRKSAFVLYITGFSAALVICGFFLAYCWLAGLFAGSAARAVMLYVIPVLSAAGIGIVFCIYYVIKHKKRKKKDTFSKVALAISCFLLLLCGIGILLLIQDGGGTPVFLLTPLIAICILVITAAVRQLKYVDPGTGAG